MEVYFVKPVEGAKALKVGQVVDMVSKKVGRHFHPPSVCLLRWAKKSSRCPLVYGALLKLSGESPVGGKPGGGGIDVDALFDIAHDISSARAASHQIACGGRGGTFGGGGRGKGKELDRVISDQ